MTEMAGIETTEATGPGVTYLGVIAVEWPQPQQRSAGVAPIPGWGVAVFDALNGRQITTVTRLEIHATHNDVVTADVTMYADENGPLFTPPGPGHAVYEGTFPFLVAEMRIAPREPGRPALAPRFQEPCPS